MAVHDNEVEAVRRQFGRVAAEYANSSYHASGPDLVALVKSARLNPLDRTLDVGCGAGHTALAMAPYVREVVSCDISEHMLDQTARLAHKRGIENISVQLADAAALPFSDREFDVVACRVAAHHFTNVSACLGEFARVLGTNGRLMIVDSYAPSDPAGTDQILNAIERLRDSTHVRNYLLQEWRSMLWDVGLSSRVVKAWPIRQDFLTWVHRSRTPPRAIRELKAIVD